MPSMAHLALRYVFYFLALLVVNGCRTDSEHNKTKKKRNEPYRQETEQFFRGIAQEHIT